MYDSKDLACWEAQEQDLAYDVLVRRILIALDCATVVKDISNNVDGHHGAIVNQCLCNFNECNFTYNSRGSNHEVEV